MLDIATTTIPTEFDLFDRMTAEMASYAEDELDMSRLVLDIYGRAVKELRSNPTPILNFLNNLDNDASISSLSQSEQEQVKMYQKCRPVFDELFSKQILTDIADWINRGGMIL